MKFFIKNQFQMDAFVPYVKSLSSVPSTSSLSTDLTKFIAVRLLNNFTFVAIFSDFVIYRVAIPKAL